MLNSNSNKDKEELMKSIDILIIERLKNLKFNYYIEAEILTDNGDGTYNVSFNNKTLSNIKAREGLTLLVNDIVLICIVNGNFSNKFIDLKRS